MFLDYSILFGAITFIVGIAFGNIRYGTVFWDVFVGLIVLSEIIGPSKLLALLALTILGKRSCEIYLIYILLIQYWKDVPLLIGNSILNSRLGIEGNGDIAFISSNRVLISYGRSQNAECFKEN